MEKDKKIVTTNFRCPRDIYKAISQLAEEDGRSINQYIVQVLKSHVKEKTSH